MARKMQQELDRQYPLTLHDSDDDLPELEPIPTRPLIQQANGTCPHGHPSRPEEEYGSGECYTCLETMDQICGCPYCIVQAQAALNPETVYARQPKWYLEFIKPLIGTVTKENYGYASMLLSRFCDCTHVENPLHDEQECTNEECEACGIVKCPHKEPLHFHHDGCPAEYDE